MKKIILLCGVILLMLPVVVSAKIGVGVGTGKIQVDQKLKAGLIYTLPSITIINTGDEPSEYGVGIQYRENQPELKPQKEWFFFEPQNFHLEPGQTQTVQIKLTLPIKGATPGNYFAFLQGFPVNKAQAGSTSVGVAAAAKLYFTVAPANFFAGLYYRCLSLCIKYSPWSYVIIAVILAAIFISLLRRYFSFNIGIGLKKK
jgi:P pilus assembly chaperone PapD